MPFQNDILGGSGGQAGGYVIPYSMWGPDAPSSGPKLQRTLTGTTSSSPKFTFATWYKKGRPTTSAKAIFQFWCPDIHSTQGQWTLDFANDAVPHATAQNAGMRMNLWNGSVSASDWNTSPDASNTGNGMSFRDYGGWMHLCHVTDYQTSPYVFVYINGVLMNPDKIYGNKAGPGYATNFAPTSGAAMNVACTKDGNGPANGGLADTYFIEGQALNPIGTFLEIDELTNEVRAIEYDGPAMTGNSFYFDYADADDFGKDQSGLGNDFTETGIAAKYQLIDSPQSATGSNFAVWNPLWGRRAQMPKLKRGNRSAQAPAAAQSPCTATFGQLVDGKWYWEIKPDSKGGSDCFIGVLNTSGEMTDVAQANHYYRFYLADSGNKNTDTNASTISYGNTYTGGDIISVALDMDNGAIYFAKNGTWQDSGDPTSGSSKTGAAFDDVLSAIPAGGRNGGDGWVPAVLCMDTTVDYICNFGQDSSFDNTSSSGSAEASDGNGNGNFYYTPPSGYLGLCSDNLPTPSIKLPEEHYKTINYTGNGSTQTISTVGFKPASTWCRDRSQGNNWVLQPSTNSSNFFISNGTAAEQSNTNFLPTFTSTGFTVGSNAAVNVNNDWYYAANWKGSGSIATNTDGSIDSRVDANPTAGFSVVEFEGTGSNLSVGHGLSQKPEWIIGKSQVGSTNWPVMTDNSNPSSVMYLNLSNTPGSDSGSYTAVSASTISIGTTTDLNQSSQGTQLWCFHSVPGYSKMGNCKLRASPEGNDGQFIYLGFKPQFFMWKITQTSHAWVIYDRDLMPGYGVTNPKNVGNVYLVPPANYADQLSVNPMIGWDYLSNGVKQRQDYSHHTMVYMAFAAWPFNYSKAA